MLRTNVKSRCQMSSQDHTSSLLGRWTNDKRSFSYFIYMNKWAQTLNTTNLRIFYLVPHTLKLHLYIIFGTCRIVFTQCHCGTSWHHNEVGSNPWLLPGYYQFICGYQPTLVPWLHLSLTPATSLYHESIVLEPSVIKPLGTSLAAKDWFDRDSWTT